jgi:hypothetical protein
VVYRTPRHYPMLCGGREAQDRSPDPSTGANGRRLLPPLGPQNRPELRSGRVHRPDRPTTRPNLSAAGPRGDAQGRCPRGDAQGRCPGEMPRGDAQKKWLSWSSAARGARRSAPGRWSLGLESVRARLYPGSPGLADVASTWWAVDRLYEHPACANPLGGGRACTSMTQLGRTELGAVGRGEAPLPDRPTIVRRVMGQAILGRCSDGPQVVVSIPRHVRHPPRHGNRRKSRAQPGILRPHARA